MRRVRYAVAASLDSFIAGPDDDIDWIIMDPEIDFGAIYAEFDTLLIGRRTFEPMARAGRATMPGMRSIVFSRSLRPEDHPDVTIVADEPAPTVSALREADGKDIWLFGGGLLFRSLLDAGLVDTVEVAVIPVLLGAGVPLLPPHTSQVKLELTRHRVLEHTGTVMLEYAVQRAGS